MYHHRKLEEKVTEYARYFKVVALLGARQVGKSSLLAALYPDYRYITFDPVQDIYGVRSDPDLFLKNFPSPLILDEIQYVPELLPALKRFVDKNDAPGQYFITGSQNLPVLQNVSESLAGRVGIVHLMAMTGDEYCNQVAQGPSWLEEFLKGNDISGRTDRFCKNDTLSRYLWRGTMPGSIELPDTMIAPYFDSYVQTYVERDVRIMEDIKQLWDFGRFVRICGALSGQEINTAHLGREIGITPQTARRWLDILKQGFQWFELAPWHGNTLKRISGKKKGYMTDTGLASYLQRIPSPDALAGSPLFGSYFETAAVMSLVKLTSFMKTRPAMYHWRTIAGAEVDVILEYNGRLFPVEIKAGTNVTKSDIRGMTAFYDTYGEICGPGICIYAGDTIYRVTGQVTAVPWNLV